MSGRKALRMEAIAAEFVPIAAEFVPIVAEFVPIVAEFLPTPEGSAAIVHDAPSSRGCIRADCG